MLWFWGFVVVVVWGGAEFYTKFLKGKTVSALLTVNKPMFNQKGE